MRLAVVALALLPLAPALPVAAQVSEPDAYRTLDYRSPVPATLEGAVVVDDEAAHALWHSGRVAFIDVLPQPPRPENLPEGTIWIDRTRDSIPGAVWLPNTGYGALAPETLAYFSDNLAAVTDGDQDAPLLFFCLEDCWMSWNAARRALEIGYRTVFWYPSGTDGWAFMDYPTEPVRPAE